MPASIFARFPKEFEGEFRGKRSLSNDDLRLEMYSAEIQV